MNEIAIFDEMASDLSGYLSNQREMRAWGLSETPFLDFLKELFATILPALLNCIPAQMRTAPHLASVVNNPNLFLRMRLRQMVRTKINDADGERMLFPAMIDGLLWLGKTCTTERAAQILEA